MGCRDVLKNVVPFSRLPDALINQLCETSKVRSFGKGASIFNEGDEPAMGLMVVIKGLVELRIKREREVILGYRGEGDLIGEDAFISKKPYRYSALCVEDTEVALLSEDVLEQVLRRYPEFYSYIASLLSKRLEVFYRELQEVTEAEHVPSFFKRRIGEILRYKRPVFVLKDSHVRDVARAMDAEKTSAVLVKGDRGIEGIITERDVVVRYVSRSEGDRAFQIMSSNIVKKSPHDLCYEAALEMIRNRIRHVVIEDEGKIVGLLSIVDLIEQETLSYIDILTEISEAETVDQVARHEKRMVDLVEALVASNMPSSEICRIITHINDEATRKVIELCVRRLGAPPCDFCFLVLGSHGRREQTIRTDQDNAMVYSSKEHGDYFERLGKMVSDALEKVGFAKCPAGVMASEPYWRGDRAQWRQRLHDLFVNPVPEKILRFSIIFDNRIIYGDETLEYELFSLFQEGISEHPGFVARLGKIASEKKPPIGLFGNFIVEKSGEHKNELDIKLRATLPIVECVRVLSLVHGIRKSNTFDRLAELKNKGAISAALAEEATFAYDFILKLRLKNHLELIRRGKPPHNYINPDKLSPVEKKLLKECFATIYKLQKETFNQAGSAYVV